MSFLALLLVVNSPRFPDQAYRKIEYRIPMRDGTKLYTAVYVPTAAPGRHPMLMERTPYSAGPYNTTNMGGLLGSQKFRAAGYIYVQQDVRGQFMSEGTYVNVRPQLKPGEKGIDESTDTYDTIDYLVKHVPQNNGNVGMIGISYPGFYAAVGAINTHPALKAVSPQAPVSDWVIGDDVHHNLAFFLQDNFDFSAWFDVPRKGLERDHKGIAVDKRGLSAYDFFLKAGTLADLDKNYVRGRIPYWEELMDHGTYDQYWKDRALPPQLKNIKCAVLFTGGWFDAEDMWGALHDYQAVKRQDKGTPDYLVMGPWFHGMWGDGPGNTFGDLNFGMPTASWYRDNVEFPFFEKYLRNPSVPAPATATVFETGVNKWRTFPQWPPTGLKPLRVYLGPTKNLVSDASATDGEDSYVNDPAQPTPYQGRREATERGTEYMIDDQTWAEKRDDVLTYKGEVVEKPITVAGSVDVDLWASTTGTDGDFIVKVIDQWPSDAKEVSPRGVPMANYEQFVRGDIMRGKFRNSLEKGEPFEPGKPTKIHFVLNDLFHTFKPGHRMMIQIQSSWFPLVDRNPNKFVDIYHASASDFQKATITIYHDPKHPSSLTFGQLGS